MRRTPKENINQSFINLIRKAHGLIENSDIEKHRHSQDQMGALFGNSREVAVTETTVGSMYAEWIRADRPHSGKKIILYCHGGATVPEVRCMPEPLPRSLQASSPWMCSALITVWHRNILIRQRWTMHRQHGII